MPSTLVEFEPPLPGSWWRGDFDLAAHEAGHAVVAVVLGVPITEARMDRPDVGVAGWVRHGRFETADYRVHRDLAKRVILVCQAGVAVARNEPLSWPPSGDSKDARNARALADALDGFGPTDWFELELRLEEILERPLFAGRSGP
jgi:hypothetical protein